MTQREAVLVSTIEGDVVWMAWPLVAAAVAFWQWRRRAAWPQMLMALVLTGYVLWICSVAFFPFPLDRSAGGSRTAGVLDGLRWVNVVPLRELAHNLPRLPWQQVIRQFGGNVLLFMPFTLLGPVFWPHLRSWWWPLAAGFGGSVLIEMLQLTLSLVAGYPYRQTDVDDVIVNACGAFLGYAVFLAAGRVVRAVNYRRA
jgi:glycopeptide antibiotics resistance protein